MAYPRQEIGTIRLSPPTLSPANVFLLSFSHSGILYSPGQFSSTLQYLATPHVTANYVSFKAALSQPSRYGLRALLFLNAQ